MSDAPRLRLLAAERFERPVALRLPFRFGVVTLREAPQVFVRARIARSDGREGEGVSAELLVPKWFDKSPHLSNEENFVQLRLSLEIAERHLRNAGTATAFGLSALAEAPHHAACAAQDLNGLVASFGLALLERAILDALCRLEGQSIFQFVRLNRIGLTSATAPDLAGLDLSAFLKSLEPAPSIDVRHTVGLLDALTRAEITADKRIGDGLPESMEEAIAAYGHRYFKLKVSGDISADLDRLQRIAAVLDAMRERYVCTLDGNEQFSDVRGIAELWRRISENGNLARLRSAILFIEQPITRAYAFKESVHDLAKAIPLEIDESDAEMGAFLRARDLGYAGISSKACKGFYRALLNRARIAKWNSEESRELYFMSAEDLTTQAGIAVQQDLALATLVGARHIERNGHHYVDGMAGAPAAEQDAFLHAHADLYAPSPSGRARLAIRNGVLSLLSLGTPGLASAVVPDFNAMTISPKD